MCVDGRKGRGRGRSVGWRGEGFPQRWYHHPVCQRRWYETFFSPSLIHNFYICSGAASLWKPCLIRVLVSLQTSQPTTSLSSCSASPTRDQRSSWWSHWTLLSVTHRYQGPLRLPPLSLGSRSLSSLTWFCLSRSGLPVLHPELHRSAARHRGSCEQTGHIRVLLHPRWANGRAAIRTRHQPQLQGRQCKEFGHWTVCWSRHALQQCLTFWPLTSDSASIFFSLPTPCWSFLVSWFSFLFFVSAGKHFPGCSVQPDGHYHWERRRPGRGDVRVLLIYFCYVSALVTPSGQRHYVFMLSCDICRRPWRNFFRFSSGWTWLYFEVKGHSDLMSMWLELPCLGGGGGGISMSLFLMDSPCCLRVQDLHVRLPVGPRAAGHRRPSPADGVSKGATSRFLSLGGEVVKPLKLSSDQSVHLLNLICFHWSVSCLTFLDISKDEIRACSYINRGNDAEEELFM